MTKVIKVDPIVPDPLMISEAALLVHRDGVVVFPTETLYGLGVSALSEKAIRKVFNIKGRNYEKPIPILIYKREVLSEFVSYVPEKAENLIKNFWPGGLTIIFEASPKLPSLLTGNTGKIGIRISNNPIAQELVKQADIPITATSANISGQRGCTTALEVYESLGNRVDLILDGGKTKSLLGSTVIDVTCTPIKIIREGVVSLGDLKEHL
ncbi:MAG: threonylcarbamoyl-AMP synthase [Desulfobacterales bacterium]|nr:threonylcarbamoyl-AMP synthase [Desulfobacterales bacterium]